MCLPPSGVNDSQEYDEPYCAACRKFATPAHRESNKHVQRVLSLLKECWAQEFAVGQSVCVRSDFLEYKDDPASEGHANNGFLVVYAGESVRLLHLDVARKGEAAWAYAEVAVGHEEHNLGRVGWLPTSRLRAAF